MENVEHLRIESDSSNQSGSMREALGMVRAGTVRPDKKAVGPRELLAKHRLTIEADHQYGPGDITPEHPGYRVGDHQARISMPGKQTETKDLETFMNNLHDADENGDFGEFLAAEFPRNAL